MKKVSVPLLGSLVILSSLVMGSFGPAASAKDTVEVVRDKDKTVYVIDSDDEYRQEEERDKDRAWKMLQNGNLWIDGRGRKQGPAQAPAAK